VIRASCGSGSGHASPNAFPNPIPAARALQRRNVPTRGDRVHAGRSAMGFFFASLLRRIWLQDRCADLWPRQAATTRCSDESRPGWPPGCASACPHGNRWEYGYLGIRPGPIFLRGRPRKPCASKAWTRFGLRCPGLLFAAGPRRTDIRPPFQNNLPAENRACAFGTMRGEKLGIDSQKMIPGGRRPGSVTALVCPPLQDAPFFATTPCWWWLGRGCFANPHANIERQWQGF